jgi:dTDP-4-amino-4,6-dideoxygalactose transaminase
MQPVFHVEGRKAQGARRKAGNAKEEHKARGIAHSDSKRHEARVVGGEVSEYLFETGLCLPSGTQMTEEDLERVIPVIKRTGKQL